MARPRKEENEPQEPAKNPADLIAYLKESGTPGHRLKPLETMLQIHPQTTAEECLEELGKQESSLGTVRKAGKWIHGPEWEPASAVPEQAEDKISQLQRENANLRQQLEASTKKAAMYERRCNMLQENSRRVKSEQEFQDWKASEPATV